VTAVLDRAVSWAPWEGPGLEHSRLRAGDIGYVASGTVLGIGEGVPFRLYYRIKCDSDWKVRKVVLESSGASGELTRTLRADGRGHWRTEDGDPIAELDDCLDTDISVTPLTNTLTIRRLSLKPGQARDVRVLYIDAPRLKMSVAEHRYTGREQGARGGAVMFEIPRSRFTAELPIDADGLIHDYPGLFRRVFPT
jgi:hypothetical protein